MTIPDRDRPGTLADRLHDEWQHLSRMNRSDRRWQLPLAAALATGLPLFVGAWFGELGYGLMSSLGGLVFLYTPVTSLSHRMAWLLACAFAMTSSYALGVLMHFLPWVRVPALIFLTSLVTMAVRSYRMGPPGALFFVMAAAIAAYTPSAVIELPTRVGLVALGALLAWFIAFFYSLWALRARAPLPMPPAVPFNFGEVVYDSVLIGIAVGLSLGVAQVLGLDRAYWVPVSCLAVMQGATLRAVWTRQLHRVLGTAGGLLVSWALLSLPHTPWTLAASMTALAFVIEVLVVRHYGLAVMFITPMTLLLAEAASLGHTPPFELIEARMIDTLLGSLVGVAGGALLHSPRFRARTEPWLWALVPQRLKEAGGEGGPPPA